MKPTAQSESVDSWHDDSSDDRLAHLLKDARRAMERALQLRLVQHNVSFGHWSFLRILWVEDGLNQRVLSERAGTTAPTTYSAIRAMESLGYVRRKRKAENRRNSYVYLTEEGRQLEKKLLPLAHEINRIAIKGLSDTEVQITRHALQAISANLLAFERSVFEQEQRGMPSTQELGRMTAARGSR